MPAQCCTIRSVSSLPYLCHRVSRYGFRTFLKNEFSGLEFDPPTQLLGMQLPANSKSLLCRWARSTSVAFVTRFATFAFTTHLLAAPPPFLTAPKITGEAILESLDMGSVDVGYVVCHVLACPAMYWRIGMPCVHLAQTTCVPCFAWCCLSGLTWASLLSSWSSTSCCCTSFCE